MEALRKLSVEQIRDYHGTYYVPHNLSLVVAGKMSNGTQSLLKVVQEQVEPIIVAHNQNKGSRPKGWQRPFTETASARRGPIEKIAKETIEFPEQDESVGELLITYTGPSPTAFLERKALDILSTYLTSSPVAPLNKEYVEIESPLCSYIYLSEDTRATLVDLPIYVGSVPTEHLDNFDEKLAASFGRIAKEGIDMARMSMVLNRDERQLRSKLESSKGDTFSGSIITDFLYGAEDGSDLGPSLNELQYYAKLRQWSEKQWVDLLKRYFVDPPYIVVIGKPSSQLAEKLEADEKARLAKQRESLGPSGIAKAKEELEAAKLEHEKPIPTDILKSFPVPDVKSISWIPVQSVQQRGKGRNQLDSTGASELASHIDKDGSPLPFFIEYDHVKSDFVGIHATFSLANLPDRLRPYISTYLSAFFSLPVVRKSGERLSHEQVINKLDDETVSYEASLGISDQIPETLHIFLQVEASAYESAISWLRDLMYGAEFDKERLLVTVAKLLQSLPELKRDGNTVLASVWSENLYDKNSTSRASAPLPQAEFIPQLVEALNERPEEVIADFKSIRKHLTDPSGVRIGVTGDILSLSSPRSTWAKYFRDLLPEAELAPVRMTSETLSEMGKKPCGQATVVSLASIESTYANHTTRSIQGFNDPEYPALRIALEVLNAAESFLWRSIRGSGLAYGAYMSPDRESGLLTFNLYRSSNSMQAYEEAYTVVKGLTDGSIELDETSLDAAKSSIVYDVAKNVASPNRAALNSFLNQALKGVSKNFNQELLEKYQTVTKADVLMALKKYVLPVFDPSSSTVVAVTAPSKADQIVESLTARGFKVERRTLEVEDGSEDGSESSGSGSGSESA